MTTTIDGEAEGGTNLIIEHFASRDGGLHRLAWEMEDGAIGLGGEG